MYDIVKEIEDLSRESFKDIKTYFTTVSTQSNDIGERVDRALKLVGAYSRVRATRANEAAISVSIAKMAGISGKALLPVLNQLTGINPTEHLPAPNENEG